MRNKPIHVILPIIVLFISTVIGCKKGDFKDNPDGDDDTGTVTDTIVNNFYILGNKLNVINYEVALESPGFFKNNKFTQISPQSVQNWNIGDMYVSEDSIVYISFLGRKVKSVPVKTLGYWSNGKIHDVYNFRDDKKEKLSVGDITVIGGDVYISASREFCKKANASGECTLMSREGIIWKNDEKILESENYFPRAISSNKGKLYTFGSDSLGNNYYTVDGEKDQLETQDHATLNYIGKKMIISENNVYMLGQITTSSPFSRIACYWKNGVEVDFAPARRIADLVYQNGELYIAGVITERGDYSVVGLWRGDTEIKRDTIMNTDYDYNEDDNIPIALNIIDMNIKGEEIYTLINPVRPNEYSLPSSTIQFYKGDSLFFDSHDGISRNIGFYNSMKSILK